MAFGVPTKEFERLQEAFKRGNEVEMKATFRAAMDAVKDRVVAMLEKSDAEIKQRVEEVNRELQVYDAQKKFDLTKEIEQIRENVQLRDDLDQAIDALKHAVRLIMIIESVQTFMAGKYALKDGDMPPIEKAIMKKKIDAKMNEVYAEYMAMQEDIKKAMIFVDKAIEDLSKEREFTIHEVAVERDKILPLLNKMKAHFLKAAEIAYGKGQVASAFKAA